MLYSSVITPSFDICFIDFAGFPYHTSYGGISFVTTLPAPMREYSPIVIPGKIVAFAPIDAPF